MLVLMHSSGETHKRPHTARIVIVTDAWHPQINGVVTVTQELVTHLTKRGHHVTLIHPGLFMSVPVPYYPDVHFALNVWRVGAYITEAKPDYIHITTEGPLGLATKIMCDRKGYGYTTSYHTNFVDYLSVRNKHISARAGLAYLRFFHRKARAVLVTTPAVKEKLESFRFKRVVVSPVGVDTNLFRPH